MGDENNIDDEYGIDEGIRSENESSGDDEDGGAGSVSSSDSEEDSDDDSYISGGGGITDYNELEYDAQCAYDHGAGNTGMFFDPDCFGYHYSAICLIITVEPQL